MGLTVRYDGTFCTTKPIKRKRVLTPEQRELRNFYNAYAEKKSGGEVVIHVTEKIAEFIAYEG